MILEFAISKCSNTPCCATGATKPLPPPPGPVSEKRSSLKKPSVTLPIPTPKIVEELSTIQIREETKEDVQVPSARVSVVEIKRASIAPEPKPELEVELKQSKETEEVIEPEKKSTVIIKPKKKSTTIFTPEHESEELEPKLEETAPKLEEQESESEDLKPESGEPEPESEEPEPESGEPEPESEEPEPRSEEPGPKSEEPRSESEEPQTESEEPQPESEELKEELPFEQPEPPVVKSEKEFKVKQEPGEPEEYVTVKGVCKRYTPKRCAKCRCAKRKEARKRRSLEQGGYKNKKSTEGITPDFGNLSIQTDLNKHDECCLTKKQSKCVGTEHCCRFKGKKRSSADSSGSKRSSLKLKNVKRPSEGLKSPSVFIPSSTGSKHRRKTLDSAQSSSRHKSAVPESKLPSTISHKKARSSILGIEERASSKRSNKEEIVGSKSPIAEFKPPSPTTSAKSDRISSNIQASANFKDSRRESERSREVGLSDRDVKISESQTEWSEKSVKQTSKAEHRGKSYSCLGDSRCSLTAGLVDDYTQTSFIDEKTKDKMQQTDTEEQEETSAEPKQRPCMCYHKELCRDNCLG